MLSLRSLFTLLSFLILSEPDTVFSMQPFKDITDTVTQEQPPANWYGFTKNELVPTVVLCYLVGRQLRGESILPNETDGLLKLTGNLALGAAGILWTTICHEAGHVVAHRLCIGSWPERVDLGSSNPDSTPLCTLYGDKIRLCGLNPLGGFTVHQDTDTLKTAAALPFWAGGSISGICGYAGLKKLIAKLSDRNEDNDLTLLLQLQPLLQLINISIGAFFDRDGDADRMATILLKRAKTTS